jgi:DNA-binding MurR/RpiR family transcriptional regulator
MTPQAKAKSAATTSVVHHTPDDLARDVLVRVRAAIPSLRPAEQRVAKAFMAQPAEMASSSIGVVAERCETSQTTVSRLVRTLGFANYHEFRLALARAATLEAAEADGGIVLSGDILPGDDLSEIVAKIAYSDARAIEETANHLDLGQLEAAVDAIVTARRIDIYGIGASGFVGADLQQKLHRIRLMAFVWNEAHGALTSSALLGPGDVVIGISHTGTTTDTIDAVRLARAHGATAIAVTNFERSPLAEAADVTLATAARETTFRSGAMSSRIAQLAVIDFLFVAVASRSYEQTVDALERTRAAVAGRRIG